MFQSIALGILLNQASLLPSRFVVNLRIHFICGLLTYLMRFLFTITFVVSIQFSFAQTQKESLLIGGDFLFNYSETPLTGMNREAKTIDFGLTPKVGFFIFSNLCVGTTLNLSFSKNKYYDDGSFSGDSGGRTLGLGAFLRYYFPINKFFIVTETSYSLNTLSRSVNSDASDDTKQKVKDFTLASGLAIMISRNASLELLLNYKNTNCNTVEERSYHVPEFKENSFYVSLGFQVYIPKTTE